MSCRNGLEKSVVLENPTMEIEDQIKEMNIVNSYDKRQSMVSHIESNTNEPEDIKEWCTKLLRQSAGISDLKSNKNKSQLKKSFSNALFKFPRILQANNGMSHNIKKGRVSNIQKYGGVRELQVNMFEDKDKNQSKYLIYQTFEF